MKPAVRGAAVGLALIALTLVSCTTVNRFDRYDLEDAALAADMRTPPEPRMDVHYDVYLNAHDPIRSVLSVGTNIGKATEASRVDDLMREALESVDVPAIVLKEAHSACAKAMGARKEDRQRRADFLLDLEIRRYGIRAKSWGSGVSLNMELTARIYHNPSAELVWRRDITVEKPASPVMFGLGDIAGNVVTAAVLSSLSLDDLSKGFERLAEESARSISRTLEDDIYSVRYDR